MQTAVHSVPKYNTGLFSQNVGYKSLVNQLAINLQIAWITLPLFTQMVLISYASSWERGLYGTGLAVLGCMALFAHPHPFSGQSTPLQMHAAEEEKKGILTTSVNLHVSEV